VATDIEKIHRMIEGDQPRAALRHVEQTLASHPNRASLLDLKVSLELSLEDLDAARQTVDKFVAAHPDSPNALACKALLLAETDEVRPAAEALQRALARVELEMPERVYEAIGTVGAALLTAGHIVAAQAHLWLHAGIAPEDDRRAMQAIVGLNHYSGLPLLLRDRLIFRTWPEDVPWIDDSGNRRSPSSIAWDKVTAPSPRSCSIGHYWAVGWSTTAPWSPVCTRSPSSTCRSTTLSRPRPSPNSSTPI
jgi:hypothetical protein